MGEVTPLQPPGPENYVWVMRRIRKLWDSGEVEFRPYAQKRMKERGLLPSDARDVIRLGRITDHSKPMEYWRYVVSGRLLDGGRALLIVELADHLLIINFYPSSRRS